jgi:hypothetical protein
MKSLFKCISVTLVLFIISCAEQNTNLGKKAIINPKQKRDLSFNANNQLLPTNNLKKLENPSSYFIIDNNRDTTITSTAGTSIFIPANCLRLADGKSFDGSAKLELKELFDKAGLVLNNKPTISNRKMLVTGGAIYINATYQGKPLLITCKDGIAITLHKTSDYPNMEMFLGNINKNGNINWIKDTSIIEPTDSNKTNQEYLVFESEMESITREYTPSQVDKVFSITRFGWINCDAFYDDPRPKTTLVVRLENQLPEDNTTNLFLVFRNINSVLPLYSGDKINYESPLIPEGEEVFLFSIAGSGSRFYYDSKSIIIKADGMENLNLKLSSEEEIKNALKSL